MRRQLIARPGWNAPDCESGRAEATLRLKMPVQAKSRLDCKRGLRAPIVRPGWKAPDCKSGRGGTNLRPKCPFEPRARQGARNCPFGTDRARIAHLGAPGQVRALNCLFGQKRARIANPGALGRMCALSCLFRPDRAPRRFCASSCPSGPERAGLQIETRQTELHPPQSGAGKRGASQSFANAARGPLQDGAGDYGRGQGLCQHGTR